MANLKAGDSVRFRRDAYHVIGNGEYPVGNAYGTVIEASEEQVSIFLHSAEHYELLKEWDNCLQWTDNEGESALEQALSQIYWPY
jgi:hypothetical protein